QPPGHEVQPWICHGLLTPKGNTACHEAQDIDDSTRVLLDCTSRATRPPSPKIAHQAPWPPLGETHPAGLVFVTHAYLYANGELAACLSNTRWWIILHSSTTFGLY